MESSVGGPIVLSIERPERLSRGHLILKFFLGWIYAGIPHGIILYFYGILVWLTGIIALLFILFTGRYPRPLFDLAVGYHRWNLRLEAYLSLMIDRYPPFSPIHDSTHPVLLSVDYPESLSRIHALFKFFLGWIYAGIPHGIILLLYGMAILLAYFIALIAILFTGSYPEALFRFVERHARWSMRLTAYLGLMTDRYPPFSGRP